MTETSKLAFTYPEPLCQAWALLMVNWGTDNSRYDIGPTPFGDGIVDSKDVMVLAEYGAIVAGDVNYDGVVDFLDLAEVVKNWLRQQP